MGKNTKTKEINVSGGMYITVARDVCFEKMTGCVKTKIGISFADKQYVLKHSKTGKTYSGDKYVSLGAWAVDEDTEIPVLRDPFYTLGGIDELENYLHGVCEEKWEENGGKAAFNEDSDDRSEFMPLRYCGGGQEWFALPYGVLKMITTIKNIRKGTQKVADLDYTPFPELAKALLHAPKFEDVPSMHPSRQKYTKHGKMWKVTTTERTHAQKRADKTADRPYARDYMMKEWC